MVKDVKDFLIPENISVKEAMIRMDKNGEKVLFVADKDARLLGSLTDGDIRRWMLADNSLADKVEKIYNKNPQFVKEGYSTEEVKDFMLTKKIEWIPVVDNFNRICEVLLWDNIFAGKVLKPKNRLDIPVVIMAGGKGQRLDPFTKILPKALIPIGDKPIIEIIMNKFDPYGIKDFYISIHTKSKMIKAYFEELDSAYNINYIEEEEPLGTAASLKFLEGKIEGSFLVTNCDIIIEGDYSEIGEFHKAKGLDITIVGSYRHFTIPYGICEVANGGALKSLNEKPEYTLLVNTGMYLLKSEVLKLIPEEKVYNMTDLIKSAKRHGKKVGVYPISEKSWIDIGQWDEYHKAVKGLEGQG